MAVFQHSQRSLQFSGRAVETLACFDSLDFYDATWLRPYGLGGMHPKLAIANEPVDEDLSHGEIFFVNEGNFALNQRKGLA